MGIVTPSMAGTIALDTGSTVVPGTDDNDVVLGTDVDDVVLGTDADDVVPGDIVLVSGTVLETDVVRTTGVVYILEIDVIVLGGEEIVLIIDEIFVVGGTLIDVNIDVLDTAMAVEETTKMVDAVVAIMLEMFDIISMVCEAL